MRNKTDMLFDAVENPEHFSDDELKSLLDGEDEREFYELMSKAADALIETSEPDIDAEWTQFLEEHSSTISVNHGIYHPVKRLSCRKVAAAVVWTAASLAVAAVVGVSIKHSIDRPQKIISPEVTAESGMYAETSSQTEVSDTSKIAEVALETPKTIVFKDEAFDLIINTISDYYRVKVNFRNDKVRDLHLYYQWDQSLPLSEIIDELNNFEQINIMFSDNIMSID